MSIEEVSIEKERLKGRLWIPKKYNKGIIITHSWRNDYDEPMCKDAAEFFYKNNYAVLQFLLPGHGENQPPEELCFRTSIQQAILATEFLKQKTGIKKIGGFGISLGAAAIGFLPEKIVNAQVLISYDVLKNPGKGFDRYKKEFETRKKELETKGYVTLTSSTGRGKFRMGKEFIEEKTLHGKEFTKKFVESKTPTLLVQGTGDNRFNETFYDFIEESNSESLIVKEMDHNILNPKHRKLILENSKAFFEKYL
jgi:esterase/lipase